MWTDDVMRGAGYMASEGARLDLARLLLVARWDWAMRWRLAWGRAGRIWS